MNYKNFTYIIVLACMLGGAALMVYADIKIKEPEQFDLFKTKEQNDRQICTDEIKF